MTAAPAIDAERATVLIGPVLAGPVLIVAITLAAVTEAFASTILSLGRGDIMGDTHATPDQFAWLDIGYTALKLAGFAAAPWFSARFDLHRLVLVAAIAMAAACGFAAMATRLDALVALRLVQGFAGGLLLVAGQTLLFLAYPRRWQPVVQALFAIGAVVTPATLAPALQGWLVDNQSWRWIFFGNALTALAACGLLLMTGDRAGLPRPGPACDFPGLVLLSASLAGLSYLCIQGNRWNWFSEAGIVWLTLAAILAFAAFVAQQALGRGRFLFDPGVFGSQDFSFAFLVSFVAGAALFGSAYLIPSFAVSVLGFTPTAAGQLLLPSAGPFALALLLAAVLIQMRRVPPFATVPFGILLIMAAMWMLSGSTSQSGADQMMPAILARGLGLGLLFLSIQLIAFWDLPDRLLASGIALFNIGRQLGGLIGVAGLQTLISHGVATNRTVLGSHVASGDPDVAGQVAKMTAMLVGKGLDTATAAQAVRMQLGRMVAEQSSVIAFDTAFYAIALLFVVAAPLLIVIKLIAARVWKRPVED